MTTTQEVCMAGNAGRPKTGRDDTTVKMATRLVQRARLVATYRNVTLNQLFDDLLTGPLDAAHAEMLRELNQADQPAADDAPARPSRRKPKAP